MPHYSVGIKATIYKTYNIAAPDEDKAVELAHQIFSVLADGDEHYEQDTDFVEEATHDVPLDAEYEEL